MLTTNEQIYAATRTSAIKAQRQFNYIQVSTKKNKITTNSMKLGAGRDQLTVNIFVLKNVSRITFHSIHENENHLTF